ncbi:hypothetical protein [Streptomyces sp. WAC 06725]|uniref:hypothetical protein n=1 Tax=Streptomyces sp. WAC 06725 TaxID=2203209 RepID=UPI000F7452EF|nr:hypothetical protein [Streptomyces sp. WAC 06725]
MPARKREDLPVGSMLGIHEVTGPSFPKLVRGRSGQSAKRNRFFAPVRCTACKREKDIREDALEKLKTSACGYCYASVDGDPEARIHVERVWNGQVQVYDRYRFHGKSRSRLHSVWTNMRERCSNPKSEKYPRYGGRGITVDPAWDNFLTFAKWADENRYAEGLEIDRINNDLGYTPENCRWITDLENLMNRSRFLSAPLQEALDARAAHDKVDTYTVIRRALEAWRKANQQAGDGHGQ